MRLERVQTPELLLDPFRLALVLIGDGNAPADAVEFRLGAVALGGEGAISKSGGVLEC